MSRALVVSCHDVAPPTLAANRTILAGLERLGVRRRSLLVIPAHPAGALEATGDCAAWLRDRQAAGDEIVLHGWLHERPPSERRLSPGERLLDALLARGRGEFLHYAAATALDRLQRGRDRLAAAGLETVGFVAPAWLYAPEAAAAVAELGFRYLTTHLRLRDLARGFDHWSFGLSNRPGEPAGDYTGRGVNEFLALAHQPLPLVRLATHPADIAHRRPFEHTLRLVGRLLATGRRPLTYREYLGPC